MFGLDSLWQAFFIVFFLVIGVLTLFMPIFVMQIRDSIRRIEKQISTLVVELPESR